MRWRAEWQVPSLTLASNWYPIRGVSGYSRIRF